MTNQDTQEHRINVLETGLKDHEAECKMRAEKNESRFDGIEKTLTKIQTILWGLGVIVVFIQPFLIAWATGKIGG